ncbi:MAG: hypothetical protein O7G30_13350 [Proteobacteria bacterium]|nr:hypothetical protein [Pseudomonadota bacterium]
MARRPRRRSRELGSSLFPFISVLACVIGTLALMIAALAIGQVASNLRGEAEGLTPQALIETLRAEVEGLRDRLARAAGAREELERARRELRALGISPDASAAERRSAVQIRVRAANVERRLAQLERERGQLGGSIRLAREEVAALEQSRVDAPITILPQGEGPLLRPLFVECAKTELRIHRLDQPWSLRVRLNTPEGRSSFDTFLRRVRVEPGASVVFLVRPDGVALFKQAEARARALTVRHAKLPLPGTGKLDFGLF